MTMLAPAAALDREQLAERYERNRRRSAELFGFVDPIAYYDRPISLRHPFVFYEGHIPAFSFLTLNERALQQESVDRRLEKLFERGIDPATAGDAARLGRADWPTREQVRAFAAECDERVLDAIANARLADDTVPRLVRAQSVFTILEHEEMHDETLIYILHQLAYDRKARVKQEHRDAAAAPNEFIRIQRGVATLGADPRALAFGWDNEFEEHAVGVPAFSIQRYPITNRDWLHYVEAGGPAPEFWVQRAGNWLLRGVFEELPLPLSWPVYVTHAQAGGYARWKGWRLPTEAEYHRAAFATPAGEERAFPWGDAPADPATHGNFGALRYDPEPVDAHPAGASAWGVQDLIGNGWEWTATRFGPFPGFTPMAAYPQYSVDFFDGKHYVMKGASPVTPTELVRRSFRNWFYADYPFMYAKFRCVSS
jgi:iron(II)-dependent oxidoreductase